jgi:heme exporter protein D
MYFESVSELMAMNGHGPYVWFCYGITALVLVGLIAEARRRRRSAEDMVRTVVRRKQANARNK